VIKNLEIQNIIFENNVAGENHGNDIFTSLDSFLPVIFVNVCSNSKEPRVESKFYNYDALVNNNDSCFLECEQKVLFILKFIFSFFLRV
jgi:hypothetical protein